MMQNYNTTQKLSPIVAFSAESRFRANIRAQILNGNIIKLPPRGILSPLFGISKEARVRIVLEEIRTSNATSIDARKSYLGGTNVARLLEGLRETNITKVNLRYNRIGTIDALSVGEAIKGAAIAELDLKSNNLDDTYMRALGKATIGTLLKTLGLDQNGISSLGAEILCTALSGSAVETLLLRRNKITSANLSVLEFSGVKTVDLSRNSVGYCAGELVLSLRTTNVKELNLSYNLISDADARNIVEALKQNKVIERINLEGNVGHTETTGSGDNASTTSYPIASDILSDIEHALAENRYINTTSPKMTIEKTLFNPLAMQEAPVSQQLSQQFLDDMENGGYAYIEDRYGEALQYFEHALTINPHSLWAKAKLGTTLRNLDRDDEAQEVLAFVHRTHPISAEDYLGLAYLAAINRDYRQVVVHCTRALTMDSGIVMAYANRGVAYFNLDNLDENKLATADLNEAIRCLPNNAVNYRNRGIMHLNQNNLDSAMADFNKAIVLKPDFSDAYCYRGNVWQKKGNINLAMRDYQSAITVNMNHITAHCHMGSLLFQQEKHAKAIERFNIAVNIPSQYDLFFSSSSKDNSRLRDFYTANHHLCQLIAINPFNADLYYTRSKIRNQMDQRCQHAKDLQYQKLYRDVVDRMAFESFNATAAELLLNDFKQQSTRVHGVDVLNKAGQTPLMTAAYNQSEDVFDWLLDKNANITLKDKAGKTALHYLSATDEPKRLVRLIELGAEINAADINGITPAHIAARYGQVAMLELLQQNGARMNVASTASYYEMSAGSTPLHLAAHFNQSEVAQWLITIAIVDHSRRDKNNQTALEVAGTNDAAAAISQALQRLPERNQEQITAAHTKLINEYAILNIIYLAWLNSKSGTSHRQEIDANIRIFQERQRALLNAYVINVTGEVTVTSHQYHVGKEQLFFEEIDATQKEFYQHVLKKPAFNANPVNLTTLNNRINEMSEDNHSKRWLISTLPIQNEKQAIKQTVLQIFWPQATDLEKTAISLTPTEKIDNIELTEIAVNVNQISIQSEQSEIQRTPQRTMQTNSLSHGFFPYNTQKSVGAANNEDEDRYGEATCIIS